MEESKEWYVGVDWASENHHVLVMNENGRKIGERIFKHGGEGLSAMTTWIMAISGAEQSSQVKIAIEVTSGPIVETLMERGFRVYSINPKQMDRLRDRFTLAGAKDDSRDAEVMASCLRTDERLYRLLAETDPVIIELREWSRMADDLTAESTRLTNRMRHQLWRYFPAMLALKPDLNAEWFLDLWETAPTPEKAMRVRERTVARLLKKGRVRRFNADEVLGILRQCPVYVAPGTTEAAVAHIKVLVERIRLTNRQLADAHKHIDILTARLIPESEAAGSEQKVQRDVEILASLPGVGRIVLATLLAEASDALQRRDYPALRTLAGVAPVTKRSGKMYNVVRRYACNHRLAVAIYHWARVAVQRDLVCHAKYAALRARGHTHGRTLRQIGDYLLNIACGMLKTKTTFKSPETTASNLQPDPT